MTLAPSELLAIVPHGTGNEESARLLLRAALVEVGEYNRSLLACSSMPSLGVDPKRSAEFAAHAVDLFTEWSIVVARIVKAQRAYAWAAFDGD